MNIEDLKKKSQEILNNAGYTPKQPTLIGESKKMEMERQYGYDQIKKWVESGKIYFVKDIKFEDWK